MRFLSNVRKRIRRQTSGDEPCDGQLVPEEIEQAQRYWIVSAQRQLGTWEESYRDLAPFDKEGVIRVGGRLRNAPLLYEEIHPILLPRTVYEFPVSFNLLQYNASLHINIVPQCKDWSIFCFDLANDLVPCKTKSAKIRLENDGLLIPVDHS